MNRSSSMPPWNDVLSAEQIADVVRYLEVVAASGKDAQRDRAQAAAPVTNDGDRAGARQ